MCPKGSCPKWGAASFVSLFPVLTGEGCGLGRDWKTYATFPPSWGLSWLVWMYVTSLMRFKWNVEV